jgi:hypothetical protein
VPEAIMLPSAQMAKNLPQALVQTHGGIKMARLKHIIVLISTVLTATFELGWFMVLNATFNNISVITWRSVLLVEETRVPAENHRPVASH